MRTCSEPERPPRCCYLAFAYAAAPANLTCKSALLLLSLRQCTPFRRLESAASFSRSKVSHSVMKLRISPAHTKRSIFHSYMKLRTVPSTEIDYSFQILHGQSIITLGKCNIRSRTRATSSINAIM